MANEKDICQSCTEGLPKLKAMKYCPYCGIKLQQEESDDIIFSVETEQGEEIVLSTETEKSEEKIFLVETEQQECELLEDFTKGKKSLEELQRNARVKYENMFVNTQIKKIKPEDIYSLVLKACDNKQILVDCLNQILTRGETAIRLAVTTMPAVLLYKVSKETIDAVAAVLKDVDAVYSVVEGDFDYSSFLKSQQFMQLDSASKAFLKSIPKTMWLGENIKFFSEAMFFEEEKGFCVLGDSAFYFFPYKKDCDFMLLPSYRLETIDTWASDGRYFAEWISNDGQTFKFEFEAEKDIKTLEALIYDDFI